MKGQENSGNTKETLEEEEVDACPAAPIQPERTLDPSPTTDRRRTTDADGHDMTLQCRHPPTKEMEWLFRDCLPELRDQSSQGRTGGRGHIINKVGLNVLGLSLNVRVR